LAKLDRMNKTLRHQEADRVPVSDFFWGSFLKRWREDLGLPADTDIYKYYDLDWIVTIPNMDPHIRQFETLRETDDEVVVRTGFEAIIRKKFADPMPAWLGFDTDTIEKAEAFEFEDPWAARRYFSPGDNQIAGVGDGFARNSPAWVETVKSHHPDFPVYGSVCEANEFMQRIIGPESLLLWVGLYRSRWALIQRANEFALEILRAQIKAAGGLLDGIVIWGDVAYRKDLFFSPKYWRQWYKPGVKALVDEAHAHSLPVIYHGCGNVNRIFEDFIEIGIDAYNPLEAKAGLDVVDLRRKYGHRIGFCGNMDVSLGKWASESSSLRTPPSQGRRPDLPVRSSVPSNVTRAELRVRGQPGAGVRQYPLQLGEFDLPDLDVKREALSDSAIH
jgi:hypothetical protein